MPSSTPSSPNIYQNYAAFSFPQSQSPAATLSKNVSKKLGQDYSTQTQRGTPTCFHDCCVYSQEPSVPSVSSGTGEIQHQLQYNEHGLPNCSIWSRKLVSSTSEKDFRFKLPLEPVNSAVKERRRNTPGLLSFQDYEAYSGLAPGVNKEAMSRARYFMERVDAETKAQLKTNKRLVSDMLSLDRLIQNKFNLKNLHLWSNEEREAILRIRKLAGQPVLKGMSGEYEIRWYMKNHNLSLEKAAMSAARDYFLSTAVWAFYSDEGLSPKMADLAASVCCLSTAVDHCNTPDAERLGVMDIFLSAANDGLDVLNEAIPFVQEAFYDLIASIAFMKLKISLNFQGILKPAGEKSVDVNANSCINVNVNINVNGQGDTNMDIHALSKYVESDKSGTQYGYFSGSKLDKTSKPILFCPERFMSLRWWDSVITPYHRIVVGLCNKNNAPAHDDHGTPYCALHCERVRRAIDHIFRYNEITDIISDCTTGEVMNELLVAFSAGGLEATKGYAEACAEVTEDVINCPCPVEPEGHIWGAELTENYCGWLAVRPRYMMMKQFYDAVNWQYETFEDREICAARGEFLPGANRPLRLKKSTVLHSKDWRPLWSEAQDSKDSEENCVGGPQFASEDGNHDNFPCSTCGRDAYALATRILMQPRSRKEAEHKEVTNIIYNIITSNTDGDTDEERHKNKTCVPYEPEAFSEIWKSLCFALYDYGCEVKAPEIERAEAADAMYLIALEFCKILWRKTGEIEDPTFLDIHMHLCKESDKVIFNTHNTKVFKDGTWRRHLVIGLLAAFFEFSPVRGYSRICNFDFGTRADYN